MIEKGKGDTIAHGFLLLIELQPHVSVEDVKFHLADATSWLEGCGKSDVEHLGEIPLYDTPTEKDTI